MEKSNIPEIIDNLIIIPDTNILLYLYKCSFNSSQNIVELLNKVKDKIVVPYRVYEEYMAHKDGEQAKTDKKYDSFTKDLKSFERIDTKGFNELKRIKSVLLEDVNKQ